MAANVLNLVVPGAGAGLDVLSVIARQCTEMGECRESCSFLQERLIRTVPRLMEMARTDRATAQPKLALFVAIPTAFWTVLKRHGGQPLHLRVIQHETLMAQLHSLHTELDTVMAYPATAAWSEWQRQSRDMHARQHEAMRANATKTELVLGELHGERAVVEALAVIQFELHRREHSEETLATLETLSTTIQRVTPATTTLPAWFIPRYAVTLAHDGKPSGSGPLGTTHCGVWTNTPVIVVLLHDDAPVTTGIDYVARKHVEEEITLLFGLRDAHIVSVLGACHVSSPPMIVYESVVANGAREQVMTLWNHLTTRNCTRAEMWWLLHEAALGLAFLHSQDIVHGHLTLHTIVVDANAQARLTEFGLDSTRACFQSTSATTTGALRWRAPECLRGAPATCSADIYSLAMCMIAAVTRRKPFGSADEYTVYRIVCDHAIPDRPEDISDDAWALVEEMTRRVPEERCLITEVTARLRSLAERASAAMELTTGETMRSLSMEEPLSDAHMSEMEWCSLVELLYEERSDNAALKWLYRRIHDESAHEIMVDAYGYERLAQIIHGTSCTRQDTLYAFGIMERACRRWEATMDLQALRHHIRGPSREELPHLLSQDRASTLEATEMVCCLAAVDGDRVRHVIPQLIASLVAGSTSLDEVKSDAANALGYVALSGPNRETILNAGGITPLVALVAVGTRSEKVHATWALVSLTSYASTNRLPNCSDRASTESTCTMIVESSHWRGAVDALVQLARDESTAWVALALLGNLALATDMIRHTLVAAGVVPVLVSWWTRGDERNNEAKTNAVVVLARLCLTHAIHRHVVDGDGDVVATLVALMAQGRDTQKLWAATAIGNLADNSDVRPRLVSAVQPLVAIMSRRANKELLIQATVTALAHLAKNEQLGVAMADEGVIPQLAMQLSVGTHSSSSSSGGIRTWTALTLANLAHCAQLHTAITNSDAITTLVQVTARSGTQEQRAHACLALLRLAASVSVHQAMVRAGAMELLAEMAAGQDDMLKSHALVAISHLSGSCQTMETPVIDSTIQVLITAVASGESPLHMECAAIALAKFAGHDTGRDRIVHQMDRVVPALIQLAQDRECVQQQTWALVALSRLATNWQTLTLMECAIPLFVQLTLNGEHDQRPHAAAEILCYLSAKSSIHPSFDARTLASLMELVQLSEDDRVCEWVALTVGNLALHDSSNDVAAAVDPTVMAILTQLAGTRDNGTKQKWATLVLNKLDGGERRDTREL